ncbi:hypothetical protein ACLB2K_036008 [Fragaria x ananassa]
MDESHINANPLSRRVSIPENGDLHASPISNTACRFRFEVRISSNCMLGFRIIATVENYHIDGNKEMIAFGMMNIIGSCTCCPLSAAPFSRTAVNYAGGKTQVSNM